MRSAASVAKAGREQRLTTQAESLSLQAVLHRHPRLHSLARSCGDGCAGNLAGLALTSWIWKLLANLGQAHALTGTWPPRAFLLSEWLQLRLMLRYRLVSGDNPGQRRRLLAPQRKDSVSGLVGGPSKAARHRCPTSRPWQSLTWFSSTD